MTTSKTAKRLNLGNLLTVISVGILVGTEIFGVAIASGWAIAGLLELGDNISYALMGIFVVFGAYALINFVKAAAQHEPIWSSN